MADAGGDQSEANSSESEAVEGASSALITTNGLIKTITTNGDTFVRAFFPSTTGGTSTLLGIDGALGVRTLVNIAPSELSTAVGTNGLVSARLELTVKNAATVVGTPSLAIHRMTRSWTEAGATWNNTFWDNGGFAQPPTALVPIVSGQAGVISFDVTADVSHFLGGDLTNLGWMIGQDPFSGSSCSLDFNSREAPSGTTVGPRLVLTLQDGTPEASPVITKPAAGQFVVDATVGGVLTVPVQGPTFTNRQSLQDWAVTNLNAIRVTGVDGQPAFTYLETVYGDPVYVNASNQVVVAYDVGAALLGGQNGIFTIGTTKYCVKDDGCGLSGFAAQTKVLADAQFADGVGMSINSVTAPPCYAGYCIGAKSWSKIATFAGITFSSRHGSETSQGSGGYHEGHKFCWKHHFIPWSCKTTSGDNTLTVQATYGDGEGGYHANGVHSKRKATNIKQNTWGFFFAVDFEYSPVEVGGGSSECTDDCEIKGVCGNHSGDDMHGKTTSGTSGAGDTTGMFCGDGPIN